MVRFLHISDSHIGPSADFMSYGHNPAANLEHLVSTINALPYPFDFVLHTGDVVENAAAQEYQLAKTILDKLRAPIFYLAGNHDNAGHLQRILLGSDSPQDRFDYSFETRGVQFAMLDTRGPVQPGGELQAAQLDWLRHICTPEGPPLVIALHHEPIDLDVPWLDEVTIMPAAMRMSNGDAFLETIGPARHRVRGIFFGHIHRASQIYQDGLLFSSAPSVFGQLKTWPGLRDHVIAPEEAAGYCLVSVDEHRTIVQQYTFTQPNR